MVTLLLRLVTNKYFLVALGGAAAVGLFYVWYDGVTDAAYEAGAEDTRDEYEKQLAVMRDNHQQRVIELEREQAAAVNAVSADYEERLADVRENADELVNGLRADNVRLRGRFTCGGSTGGVSETAGDSGERDGGTGGGLRRDDAEFLVRFAERADRVTEQLHACQDTLRAVETSDEVEDDEG